MMMSPRGLRTMILYQAGAVRAMNEAHYFEIAGQRGFLSTEYTVTAQSNRMGYRLSGESIKHKEGMTNIISADISLGTVQVPSDGQPFILMADCQTYGGNALITIFITNDVSLLAQMQPRDKLGFKETIVANSP
jgi:antagonist of KipI